MIATAEREPGKTRATGLCTERTTIGGDAIVQGTGLHLGEPCRLVFRPAPTGSGVMFHRSDRADASPVQATVSEAVDAERRTQLGNGSEAFHTVEHVLAAVGAMQIDDLVIQMDGPEPPIMGTNSIGNSYTSSAD